MTLSETWTPDPIVGWRVWIWPKVAHGPLRVFRSTYANDIWQREMPPARCHATKCGNKTAHATPSDGASCGYYSLKMPLLTDPWAWGKALWDVDGITYHGTVGLTESWGEVIEYEHGYRAERIRITALMDLPLEWFNEFGHWYLVDERFRASTNRRDHDAYESRLHQAAEKYRVPVISIEDAHARR